MANKEKIKAYRKAYYEANKEKVFARLRRNRLAAARQSLKAEYEANPEKLKAKYAKIISPEANKEKLKDRQKAYRKAKKEKKERLGRIYLKAQQSENENGCTLEDVRKNRKTGYKENNNENANIG